MDGLRRLREELEARGFGGALLVNEPMARHTTFAIGGPADLLLVARTLDVLQTAVQLAWSHGVPVLVLGSGSNVLVADAGVRGLVVLNECRQFAMDAQGLVTAQSGVLLRELAQWTVARGWQGLEWAVGVPGTVGGAVVGNAGAYGGYMSDSVRWVTLLSPDGPAVKRLGVEVLRYGYRTSALKTGQNGKASLKGVVLEAGLQLRPGNAEELARIAAKNNAERKARTPEGCCAGSVFKRTPQYPAGFLIEQAGLKGRRIGGAEVSRVHANFLMNTGNATAADVKALIELVQAEVLAAFGQRLELEIEFVGAWEDSNVESKVGALE